MFASTCRNHLLRRSSLCCTVSLKLSFAMYGDGKTHCFSRCMPQWSCSVLCPSSAPRPSQLPSVSYQYDSPSWSPMSYIHLHSRAAVYARCSQHPIPSIAHTQLPTNILNLPTNILLHTAAHCSTQIPLRCPIYHRWHSIRLWSWLTWP